jgi:predicted aspartyl protease
VIFFFSGLASGQSIVTEPPVGTIAFELTNHKNLSVTSILNGQDTLQLMLHTAASFVTLTTASAKKGLLPKFTIGSVEFTDVPVSFFEGALGRQKVSVMGGDFLKRFNIVIDADRAFIYLKTNGLSGVAYTVFD